MIKILLLLCVLAASGCSFDKPLCLTNCGDKVEAPADPCGRDMKDNTRG